MFDPVVDQIMLGCATALAVWRGIRAHRDGDRATAVEYWFLALVFMPLWRPFPRAALFALAAMCLSISRRYCGNYGSGGRGRAEG